MLHDDDRQAASRQRVIDCVGANRPSVLPSMRSVWWRPHARRKTCRGAEPSGGQWPRMFHIGRGNNDSILWYCSQVQFGAFTVVDYIVVAMEIILIPLLVEPPNCPVWMLQYRSLPRGHDDGSAYYGSFVRRALRGHMNRVWAQNRLTIPKGRDGMSVNIG